MPRPPIETDEQLLERIGTDPAEWAEAFLKMPIYHNADAALVIATAWFAAAIRAGRQSQAPEPMSSAPKDGGWVLGLVLADGPTDRDWQPWVPVTWGDGGWTDDDGNSREPTGWVPLPDPQPRPTGWRPPEGTIRAVEHDGSGWTDSAGNPLQVPWRWTIFIARTDGTYDEYRDCIFRVTREEAEATAARWAEKYGLPVEVFPLPSNVVSFKRRADDA